MEIFVNNVAPKTESDEIRKLFENYGEVSEVKFDKRSMTKLRRGFAFITMRNSDEGRAAIQALDGTSFNGKKIVVQEARPRS